MSPTKAPKTDTELRHLRVQRGLSLRQIAELVDCVHSAVVRWETHRAEPEPRFRRNYARALGLTVGELGSMIYRGSV